MRDGGAGWQGHGERGWGEQLILRSERLVTYQNSVARMCAGEGRGGCW